MKNNFSEIQGLYANLATVFYHHDRFWAGTPEDFLKHLYCEFDYRSDDIWLNSYPRSGTAWSYELLNAIICEGDLRILKQAQHDGKILKFLPIEVGSHISVQKKLDTWKALPSPRVIPTHLTYSLFPKTAIELQCKRIYVLRNPKDVAVSFYHFHRAHKLMGYYKGTWDNFLNCFLCGQVLYGSWFEHTLGWWKAIEEAPENVMVLFYEDMKQDLPGNIRRIGSFLGKHLSNEAVAAIAKHTSFASMSKNPFTNRESNPTMDLSIAPFLRKGQVKDWKSNFTERQNEQFKALWNQKMKGSTLYERFEI